MNPEKYPLVYTYPKKSSRIFDSVYLQMGVYFFLTAVRHIDFDREKQTTLTSSYPSLRLVRR